VDVGEQGRYLEPVRLQQPSGRIGVRGFQDLKAASSNMSTAFMRRIGASSATRMKRRRGTS